MSLNKPPFFSSEVFNPTGFFDTGYYRIVQDTSETAILYGSNISFPFSANSIRVFLKTGALDTSYDYRNLHPADDATFMTSYEILSTRHVRFTFNTSTQFTSAGAIRYTMLDGSNAGVVALPGAGLNSINCSKKDPSANEVWISGVPALSTNVVYKIGGTSDASFLSSWSSSQSIVSGEVNSMDVQNTGKLIVVGTFAGMDGTYNKIARLHPGGNVDTTFTNISINGNIQDVKVLPDNRIVIAGTFTTVGGVARRCTAMLTASGTLDTAFANPVISGFFVNGSPIDAEISPISRIFLYDNSIYLLGSHNLAVSGVMLNSKIAKLNLNGTRDTTFNPQFTSSGLLGTVQDMIASNTHFYYTGQFTSVNGAPRINFGRTRLSGF